MRSSKSGDNQPQDIYNTGVCIAWTASQEVFFDARRGGWGWGGGGGGGVE